MKHKDLFVTRREMLARCGMGMGSLALYIDLGATETNPLAPKQPPLFQRRQRVLHLFMNGGCSHVDTFDPKPSLTKYAGKAIPITLKTERHRRRVSIAICVSETWPERR